MSIKIYGNGGGSVELVADPALATDEEFVMPWGIESGSNTDATWTKFPDGTLIVCGVINTSGDITTPWASLFEGASSFSKDFPTEVTFISPPFVTYGGKGIGGVGGSFWLAIHQEPTATRTGKVFLVRPQEDTLDGDRKIQYQAIGRWK